MDTPWLMTYANETETAHVIVSLMDAIDNGPWAYDPKIAVVLAISTPLVILCLCCTVMVCRGVPYTPCGGVCTWCKAKPTVCEVPLSEIVGMHPDQAIGEHQDENCDVDSIDEPERLPDNEPALDEEAAADSDSDHGDRVHRECCSKMAAALESGELNGHGYPSPRPAVTRE